MTKHGTATGTVGGAPDLDLEGTLQHALALAGKKWVADRVQRRVDEHVRPAHRLARAAPHLIGYGTLLGYLAYRHQRAKAEA